MRRFVIVGRTATADDDFRLEDLAGTSGRIDVLLRCVRAALLHSHGLRRDVVVYLVLRGGPRAPRVLRVEGERAKFIRPDERSLATLAKKVLASHADAHAAGFVEIKPGVSVARGDVDRALADAGPSDVFVLDEAAPDIRHAEGIAGSNVVFVLGDHLGLDDATIERFRALGARAVAVGPVSLHADDVVAIVSNEAERAAAFNR